MRTFGLAASGCWACSAADSDMPHLLVHRAPAAETRETSANVPQLRATWWTGFDAEREVQSQIYFDHARGGKLADGIDEPVSLDDLKMIQGHHARVWNGIN